MLSRDALNEFKQIWREEKGEDLPDDLATEMGVNLLNLFDAIYKPVKKEWMDDYDNDPHIKSNK